MAAFMGSLFHKIRQVSSCCKPAWSNYYFLSLIIALLTLSISAWHTHRDWSISGTRIQKYIDDLVPTAFFLADLSIWQATLVRTACLWAGEERPLIDPILLSANSTLAAPCACLLIPLSLMQFTTFITYHDESALRSQTKQCYLEAPTKHNKSTVNVLSVHRSYMMFSPQMNSNDTPLFLPRQQYS